MPDIFAQALSVPGVWWMGPTILVAGILRGFSGFGTALIFVPIAGQFLPAADVVLLMSLTGIASTVALLPGALSNADKSEAGVMALGAALSVPVGVQVMTILPMGTIRWAITFIVGATLLALVRGWRYHGQLAKPGLAGVGLMAGAVGGLTGLTGPVVILFYLAGTKSVNSVRANIILFLALLDTLILFNLFLAGLSDPVIIALAVLLGVPYFTASLIGQRLFDPRRENVYRWITYGVIGLAMILGAPVFD